MTSDPSPVRASAQGQRRLADEIVNNLIRSDEEALTDQIVEIIAAAEARGRQQAEQERDDSQLLREMDDGTRWRLRAEAAEQHVAALTQALKDIEPYCPCKQMSGPPTTHLHVATCPVCAALTGASKPVSLGDS